MDVTNKYGIYIGTARGALQYTECRSDEKISYSVPDEQSEITALEWGRSDDEIIVGYKNEYVQFYNIHLKQYTKTINKLEGDGAVVGVAPTSNFVLIAKREGIITLWRGKKSDYFSINLDENGTLDAFLHNKNRENVIGTGGEHNDFKVWNVETKQCVFKAKSLGHDELNLPIPTSIRGIASVPGSSKLNICATKEGHVLLYDEDAQRKPVVKFFEKKGSYTCVSSAHRERQCLVGTTKGYMQLLDLRAPGKCLKTFTNFTGSITSIACDAVENVVAVASLDRFLRIFDLNTKDLLHKVYLKQSLTKLLIKPLVKEEPIDELPPSIQDEEYEELFDNMETIPDKEVSTQKRKSRSSTGTKRKKKKGIAP